MTFIKKREKAVYRVAKKLAKKGVVRASTFTENGLSSNDIRTLQERGEIQKIKRGFYRFKESPIESRNSSLAEASIIVPKGVICLLSSLAFHEIGTQLPGKIWMAISRNSHVPKGDVSPVKILRFSEKSFETGVEYHDVSGIKVRVYSVEKTIADCFKYRNDLGLDVALEALNDAHSENLITMDDLVACSKVNRVYSVMKPYLEGLMYG